MCNYFDYTRQALYKNRIQKEKNLNAELKIIAAVIEIRKRQPMIGGRKIQYLLRKQRKKLGVCIGRDRLFALLREHDLLIVPQKKYVKTTNSIHRFRKYKNLIKNINIISPDQVYVSDITYLKTIHGFCYLSLITDLFSRKIVGYCLSKSLAIEGCLTALKMALKSAKNPKNLIHHSDRGIQYCSHAYVELLSKKGVKISMTEKDHVYENAVAERMNGILKTEFMLGETLPSFKIAQRMVAEAVQIYNSERPHMSLNFKTPNEVHYSINHAEVVKLLPIVTLTSDKNVSYGTKNDNSEVINTQSTSYPQNTGGFKHIFECIYFIKNKDFEIIFP